MDQVRGDLLNELLKKKVTHSDIKQHNLTEAELNVLYLVDSMDRREFVYMYRRNHPKAHEKSGFNHWQRKREKFIRFFTGVDLKMSVDTCKRNGIDIELVHEGYKDCLPVCNYYASYHGYSMELLHIRDELFKQSMNLDEVAKLLCISLRQLRRLISKGKIKTIENNRILTYTLTNYLWNKIFYDCTLLVKIAPEKLENFLSNQ